MHTFKYIILCILFLTAIPSEVIIAQQASADSTAINELEDKYDSVITKAALALTGAQYKEASDYYREASLLKPAETYPLKMIKYVESIMAEAAEKQRLADESKRRAQIKDDLNKANNAILNRSWDSARALFSNILALHPEKADEEYAKSKITAIDLEQKRIILRTPLKPEPVVIAPPKNRSEARARRKLAERSAMLASAPPKAVPQTQAASPVKNAVVAPVVKGSIQKPTAASLPQKTAAINVPAKETPQKPIQTTSPTTNAATAAQATKEAYRPPVQTAAPAKSVVVAAPAVKEVPQKPIQKPLPTANAATAAQATKEAYRPPVQTTAPAKSVTVAAPAVKEVPQKPIQTPPPTANAATAAQATKEAYRPPVQTTAPAKSVTVAAPAMKETPQKPIQTPQTTLPNTNPAVSASANTEVPQRSTETPLPVTNAPVAAPAITKAAPRKSAETSLPSAKIPAAAPVINQVPQQSTAASSPEKNGAAPLTKEISTDASSLKLSDSSDYIKLICKDISFIGTNAYVKVLIQNYSSTASFTADTLQVSLRKNNGIIKKLDQRFISTFPVVTPLQETIFVAFTDASAGVEPDDVFILEMRDRKNKTTFSLQIPWALYQQQKNL